jgi:hypothetical protein
MLQIRCWSCSSGGAGVTRRPAVWLACSCIWCDVPLDQKCKMQFRLQAAVRAGNCVYQEASGRTVGDLCEARRLLPGRRWRCKHLHKQQVCHRRTIAVLTASMHDQRHSPPGRQSPALLTLRCGAPATDAWLASLCHCLGPAGCQWLPMVYIWQVPYVHLRSLCAPHSSACSNGTRPVSCAATPAAGDMHWTTTGQRCSFSIHEHRSLLAVRSDAGFAAMWLW